MGLLGVLEQQSQWWLFLQVGAGAVTTACGWGSGEGDAGCGRWCRDADLKFILFLCFLCYYRLSEAPSAAWPLPQSSSCSGFVPHHVWSCVPLLSGEGSGVPFLWGLRHPGVLQGLQPSSPSEGWEVFVCLVFVCFCRCLKKLLKRREPWSECLLCFCVCSGWGLQSRAPLVRAGIWFVFNYFCCCFSAGWM